ncbi:alpha/beta fold hydrolase, partial [Agrobacterium sp. P15N1-A]|uniref:alpha/beta fold hydrolase n=1 Tax=Agrobacterium sp. P15N1-A TaxID=3342820 RepID=UPI0037D3B530
LAHAAYEAPQGPVETALAAIWSELLGVDRISRNDSFFALGGHSLLAVRLLSKIRGGGFQVTLEDLFRNLSLKILAERIEGDKPQNDNSAIVVHSGDGSLPLFFVPTGFGDHSYVFELARNLDGRLPIYVLPWPPGLDTLPRTIEAMAKQMAAMMRQVQPNGPYRLAGYSYGGILAYAIANHLGGIDETVSFIGLIDCRLPSGNTEEPIDVKDMLVNYVADRSTPDNADLVAALRQASHQLTLQQLIAQAQVFGLLPADRDPSTECLIWQRRQQFDRLIRAYNVPEMSVDVFQFHALEAPQSSQDSTIEHGEEHRRTSPFGGWENVLGTSSITLVAIPGDHLTMMTDATNRKTLGEELSNAISASISIARKKPDDFDPLIPLTAPNFRSAPMFCIPGAGSSVTGFVELVCELTRALPIYGLQPRGICRGQQPHATVEAAANYYLNAIDKLSSSGPVHLLGHSFGGAVAFEMACRLQAQGRIVASLTIIDSEPPGLERDLTDLEAFTEFVEAIALTFDCQLVREEAAISGVDIKSRLGSLHAAMTRLGLLPARSRPEDLFGPFATFVTALRAKYHPSVKYGGRLRLVQLRDSKLAPTTDARRNSAFAEQWSRFATEVDVWQGPGDHFSILRKPHVLSLVEWLELATET